MSRMIALVDFSWPRTSYPTATRNLEHRRDALLDRKPLVGLRADEDALDDLDLEEHVVQRLEELLVRRVVLGHRRRQLALLELELRRAERRA